MRGYIFTTTRGNKTNRKFTSIMINTLQSERNPWVSLLIVVFLSFGSAIITPLIFSYLIAFAIGVEYVDLMHAMSDPMMHMDLKVPLLTMQFLTSATSFILVPLFYIWKYENGEIKIYLDLEKTKLVPVLTAVFLAMTFMVVNSVFIEWNMNVKFPEGIESIARRLEDQGKELTLFFTTFDSVPYFVYAILVVAVVPAIGEELLFRGLIQRQIFRITGNAHAAIWLAAIFFSAFHFQFYGFVPRMLLGALFGYLYFYSGNLVYPILAHFVNNGFTLLVMYLYQNGVVHFDIENADAAPLESVLIFAIIGAVLVVIFIKQFQLKIEIHR